MKRIIDKANCTEIGFVKKTHGIKGELLIYYREGIEGIIDESEYIFFEYEGLLVPFFIESVYSIGPDSAIVHFETLASKEISASFVGCKLYIESEKLSQSQIHFTPFMMKGFTLFDLEKGEIGEITVVDDFGGNVVLTVLFKNKEILIPFNEELITHFNSTEQTVTMNCPEGLIELN